MECVVTEQQLRRKLWIVHSVGSCKAINITCTTPLKKNSASYNWACCNMLFKVNSLHQFEYKGKEGESYNKTKIRHMD